MYLRLAYALTVSAICCGTLCNGAVAQEVPGVRHFVKANVTILTADGLPSANEQLFLAEQIGGTPILSERMVSDKDGQIHLNGYYCLPMVVATNGGYIAIREWDAGNEYTVRKKRDGVTIAKAFGAPDETLLRDVKAARLTCR